jgi:hypothetical protein
VLDVEARKRKCSLTIKRSLVESTLPAITSYDVAAAGAPTLISHGFVTAIRPGKGIIVTFYNNVFGFVSEKELEKAVRRVVHLSLSVWCDSLSPCM